MNSIKKRLKKVLPSPLVQGLQVLIFFVKLLRTKKNIHLKYNPKKQNIDILNFQFYDYEGERLFIGGAERYVLDLAKLFTEKRNYNVRLFQASRKPFLKKVENFEICGLKTNSVIDKYEDLFEKYLERTDTSSITICSPFTTINRSFSGHQRSLIGICHGIFWDQAFKKNQVHQFLTQKQVLFSIQNLSHCVSVDTNFINWCRTIDSDAASKIMYIPNYVDTNTFYRQESLKKVDFVSIVFPRRVYSPRGADLMFESMRFILKKYQSVRLTIVGQAEMDYQVKLKNFLNDFPNQVTHSEKELNEMPDEYRGHDIALIPTVASEGTSLSCLEAMASGCAVIATNVGGLPNLIFDGYNGILIPPSCSHLIEAIEKLILDKELREKIVKNGIAVSATFSKQIWDEKWLSLVDSIEVSQKKDSTVDYVHSNKNY